MFKPLYILFKVLLLFRLFSATVARAHEIVFCGEKIPVTNTFVSSKLMDVIRKQIPTANLPELRKRAKENFPRVEHYLRSTGLPLDLKYLAIVESVF